VFGNFLAMCWGCFGHCHIFTFVLVFIFIVTFNTYTCHGGPTENPVNKR
jgi:hypothetical protein